MMPAGSIDRADPRRAPHRWPAQAKSQPAFAGGEAAFMAHDDVEHAVEVADASQPGVSLNTIGVDVAARGKLRFQPVPRSPPIFQPAGFASDARLSYTALPVPMPAV